MEKARLIVDAAADRQATDIVLLDLADLSTVADHFVICSATSERQLRAVVESITDKLRESGSRPLHTEGTPDSGWVLMDYGDVIAHIFAPEERKFYDLDEFWSKAKPVLKIQ